MYCTVERLFMVLIFHITIAFLKSLFFLSFLNVFWLAGIYIPAVPKLYPGNFSPRGFLLPSGMGVACSWKIIPLRAKVSKGGLAVLVPIWNALEPGNSHLTVEIVVVPCSSLAHPVVLKNRGQVQ